MGAKGFQGGVELSIDGAELTPEETKRFFAEEQAKADAAFAEEETTKPVGLLEGQVAELLDGYEGNIFSDFLSLLPPLNSRIKQIAMAG